MRSLFSLLFLLISISVYCQINDFETEVIIDSVNVKNSNDTFALYLPKKFDNNKKSSIVFIFDPMARGKIGIKPFIESAEKYNHILVCSNNSKNGLMTDNFIVFEKLFESVLEYFSIDNKQIFLAGFSGGSRLATSIAVLSKQIQGVIACGGGFSSNIAYSPYQKENFSYAGMIGDRDMNYQEMFGVKTWLNKFQIENELFIYEGDHKWPASNHLLKAFDWLELQSYKKNIKAKNDTIVYNSFNNIFKDASILEKNDNIELSVLEYERLIKNFSNYYSLDSISAKIVKLKRSKKYKQELKRNNTIKKVEEKYNKLFFDRFNHEISNPKTKKEYKWWRNEIKKFNEKYLLSEDVFYQKMGERINFAIFVAAIESSYNQQNTDNALYCHNLIAIIFPEKPFPFYLLAKDYALLNDEDGVCENIKKAISNGFSNKDLLLNSKEFDKFKDSKKFMLLINELDKTKE